METRKPIRKSRKHPGQQNRRLSGALCVGYVKKGLNYRRHLQSNNLRGRLRMVNWKEVKWNHLLPVLKCFVVHLEAPKTTLFSSWKRRYLKQLERRNLWKLKTFKLLWISVLCTWLFPTSSDLRNYPIDWLKWYTYFRMLAQKPFVYIDCDLANSFIS